MRVLLSTTSGAGHFRPLLPLARALQRAGHDLACAAPREAAGMVEREGLRHLPFDGVPPDEPERVDAFSRAPGLPRAEGRQLVGSVVFGRLNTTYALPGAHAAVAAFSPDLVLHESAELAVRIAAEAVGVRSVAVHPVLAMDAFPAAVAAGTAALRAALGLDPDARGRSIVEGPTVSWFPRSFDVPEAPAHVRRFRDPGGPVPGPLAQRSLVHVTLGTEAPGLPFFATVVREVVSGAAAAGLPVVVAVGRPVDTAVLAGVTGDVTVETWVDQAQLLPRTRVVVTHAGAGTTSNALAAGVPIVAVPLFADQPDNAERIEATGCGRRVAPVATDVADAVRALADGAPPEGCVRMAREQAALPPAGDAVPWLEELAANR